MLYKGDNDRLFGTKRMRCVLECESSQATLFERQGECFGWVDLYIKDI